MVEQVAHIALSQGQVAMIDVADYERVASCSWHAQWDRSAKSFYARGRNSGPLMHRFILGLTDPSIRCDHHNGNTLDNRRANLRVATSAQNNHNRKPRSNNRSGHTGVHWNAEAGKWCAKITDNGRAIFLGYFRNKEEAIGRRVAAEREFYGEFAYSAR